ncbi:MAG TPA: hypothetical protein VFG07_06170 [Thermoplasmata archaeon]|nr:hypothetical protein [Thermoplasmata archaeon]
MPASEPEVTAPKGSRLAEAAPTAPAATSPIAVVWCRQVDNEAESPGYTTVPEEFPGLKETLEVIRIVGHLTVNVADTHDYWDPDPNQPLSYYPNIFLYPAYGGRYTCLGRMFLSTEDRPRLGMKTLVLDTQQLLATGDFGGAILRWHASMGGSRSEATRAPPVPDGRLYDLLGEGLLFHKGATDPVLAVASDEWESAMQVVLDLIRSLPASLVALGAILAFPYFLPQPKTNLHEFTEQLPLGLALMRVPRGEAAGDRHEKRMSSWESSPLTLRDLTAGYPGPSKGKDTTPLILQHLRDHNTAKLGPIVQRVDVVEMPRLKSHLADPERQGGRDRRKEMWRIGTAMESAALLLQRARGRQVPVNVETAKRAQEYLQARLPDPSDAPTSEPLPVAVIPANEVASPLQHPPWLQRPAEAAPPLPSKEPEVVPVSVSDDPSLLSVVARPAPPPLSAPPPAAVPAAAPARPPGAPAGVLPPVARPTGPTAALPSAPSGVKSPPPPGGAPPPVGRAPTTTGIGPAELAGLKQALGQDLLRLVDERMAALAAKAAKPPSGLDPVGQQQVEDRLKTQREQLLMELTRQVATLQERLGRDQAAVEIRQRDLLGALVNQSLDRRWVEQHEPKISEGLRRIEIAAQASGEAAESRIKAEVERLSEELRTSAAAMEETLQGTLSAQQDLQLRDAAEREEETRSGLSAQLTKQIDQRLGDLETRRTKEVRELEQKLSVLIDGRQRDLQEKLVPRSQAELEKLRQELERKLTEVDTRTHEASERVRTDVQEAQVRAMADLQVRLQAYTDQKLKEDVDRERQKYLELLARLKGEVDSSLARLIDSAKFDGTIREKTQRALDAQRIEIDRAMEARVASVEASGKIELAEALDRLRRVEISLEARQSETQALEESVRAELEDLDRRAQILADRLVPVVRKTWQRISDLEKAEPREDRAAAVEALQRDFQREVRRLDTEVDERFTELRERMETAISNQGRVWLTLVRQLSQLTEDRRVIEESRALLRRPAAGPAASDESTSLEALPSLLQSRTRTTEDEEDEEEESASPARSRRRRRSFSRS